MSARRYLEDFAVGEIIRGGALRVEPAAIKEFAAKFDPQVFHLDEEAAKDTFFDGLAASGWHTAAMTMRLIVETLPLAGGVIGAGGTIAWPKPLRPGTTLSVAIEILEIRPSRSRPERGMLKMKCTTHEDSGEVVQTLVADLVVPRRPG
ncbi:MAG: dehydratase [Alphaproteobacteria bacterium]|nr:dehydratase [Alphaproteobacteria bacterium]